MHLVHCKNIRMTCRVCISELLCPDCEDYKKQIVLIKRQTQISSKGQMDQIKSCRTQGIKLYYANHSKGMQRLGTAQRKKQTKDRQRDSPLHRWALGRQSLVEVRCCRGSWGKAWGDGASSTNAALRVALPGTFFSALMGEIVC